MPRWGTTEYENGFLFARGGSATRSHDPADHGSTGSAEEVIIKAVAMPRWGTTKDENGFLFARGGSATRSHDPADRGSTGSAEEVIF
jgi:hypothetical protein